MYAKCDAYKRLELWDNIYNLSKRIFILWLVGGDFNVILSDEEKIGGLSFYPQEYEDIAFCISSCKFFDIYFKGIPFTWWNVIEDQVCIV